MECSVNALLKWRNINFLTMTEEKIRRFLQSHNLMVQYFHAVLLQASAYACTEILSC